MIDKMKEIIIKTEHTFIYNYIYELFEMLADNNTTNVTYNISKLLEAVSNSDLHIDVIPQDNDLTIINI